AEGISSRLDGDRWNRQSLNRRPDQLPDAGPDHALPVAVPADDFDAGCDAGHVGGDDEIGRPAARALTRSLEGCLGFFSRNAMVPMLLMLVGALPRIATHDSILTLRPPLAPQLPPRAPPRALPRAPRP